MKKWKKLIALLLAVCMLPVLPVSAEPVHPFGDVPDGAWYAPYVEYVCRNGLMNGVGDGSFGPEQTMNRAMVVTALYRMAGLPESSGAGLPFADVEPETFYGKPVAWAYETGVVMGVSDSGFAPGADVLRCQLVTFFYRYAEAMGHDVSARADLGAYRDHTEIPAYAADAFSWAVAEGIIGGMSADTLAPNETANRAQCAAILLRADRLLGEPVEAQTDSYMLEISPRSLEMLAGESKQLEIRYDGPGVLEWKSTDPGVAEVSQTGKVTALAEGVAYIQVTDGTKNAACKVVVHKAYGLLLNTIELKLNVGDSKPVSCIYEGDPDKLSWSSSDETVATVNELGWVTAVNEGEASIAVTDGVTTKYLGVSVFRGRVLAKKLVISHMDSPFGNMVTRYKGDYVVLRTKVEPADAEPFTVACSSDHHVVVPSFRTDEDGYREIRLDFKGAGTATVTLMSADGNVFEPYTIVVEEKYSFDPGDHKLTPEAFADSMMKVMAAHGFTYERECERFKQFKVSKDELTFDKAVELGQETVHKWWREEANPCLILYLGQDYRGDYVFHKCSNLPAYVMGAGNLEYTTE